ncbi:hypothetical protein 2 [Beihai picorna-like virus 81]|uniref:hypothetical protein 2 n=1 Tax=Beihai picorna-like virus 81 TaxID=1922629 RepID=UPI00090C49E3|nr:hypothetical protein 2 [Beihai picorna-like virus 81]APG77932.1 hypothetical protein 2 [Beihai picorna-like virus 81]
MQQSNIENNTVEIVDISHDVQAPVDTNPMPSTLKSISNTNSHMHSLIDMLTRFSLIKTFKWNSDSTVIPLNITPDGYINSKVNTLESFQLPQALLDSSNLIRQKINNFMLMKADIEIDVKVNANPFQQGALLAAYFPRSLNTSKYRAQASEFLASVTSAPHRKLVLEQANSLRVRIPYAHILDWIDLTKTDNTFGVLNLYVLSPLKGETSMEEVDVSVRMRFVDLKLEAPTNRSLLTQTKYEDMERERCLRPKPTPRIHGFHAQMAEGEKQGPVTKISSAIATIGETLSVVPVIGNAAGLVGWFARSLANVAAVFGWSKPTMLTMPQPNVHKPAAYMGNTEGQDASCVLASLHDNAIDNSSMTPAKVDEMSLDHILQHPNMIGRYTIPKTSFTPNSLLFSFTASPFSELTQQTESNGQDFCAGSFSFTSLLFKYWRGSLHYAMDLIKTQYHSARIVAVYFPNTERTQIPAELGELMTTNSHAIFDLNAKSGDEFSLEKPLIIPYTSDEPWKRTLFKNENDLYDGSTLNTSIGCVGVYCLNELVCPPTVSQDVTFILSLKGGIDYELGLPQIQLQGGFSNTPVSPPDVQTPLVDILNELYGTATYAVQNLSTGGSPSFYTDATLTTKVIDQSIEPTEWLLARQYPYEAPDGVYNADVFIDFRNGLIFEDKTYAFTVTVLDNQIVRIDSEDIRLISAAIDSDTEMTFSVPPPARFQAQMNDGTHEQLTGQNTLADVMPHRDISLSTTGEYIKSLRPLIKRFVKTRQIQAGQPTSLTPADFNNYDSTTPTLPVGNRSWAADGTGGLLPESWLNLVSYLFRFCSGSVRSKVFIPYNVQATTSLDISDNLLTEFDTEQRDPAFVTQGVINNAVETTVPYYGQFRARTVGDQIRGLTAKQRIELTGTGTHDYYEAAGDDFSFWFMIGPPIMRPIDVLPTSVPVISTGAKR